MAWLSRNTFTPSDKLHADDLNNLANDDRTWGGDVNGGGHILSNVILVGVEQEATLVSSVFGRSGDVVAVAGDYTAAQVTNAVSTLGSYADPSWITSLAWSKIAGAPVLSGFVPTSRQVIAGAGLTGGGALSADVTLTAKPLGASGASHSAGIAPDPGATTGATRYLREDATWAIPAGAGGGLTDPTTTKGDLLARSASAITRLGVGTDGQILTADSTQTLGLKWAAAAGGGSQTPWTSNINGGGFTLSNVSFISSASVTTNALTVVSGLKATAGPIATAYLSSSDSSNQLSGILNLNGGSGSAMRLSITCAEQSIGPHNITLCETGGNVGIGTATPGALLDVNGTVYARMAFLRSSLKTDAALGLGAGLGYGISTTDATPLNAFIQLMTDPTPSKRRIVISALDSSVGWHNVTLCELGGNVGIATATPLVPLHVVGTGAVFANFVTSAGSPYGGALYFGDSAFNNATYYNATPGVGAAFNNANTVAGDLAFFVYNNGPGLRKEVMRIAMVTGNVGLGMTNPTHLFQLSTDDAYKPGTNTWGIISDARVKRNARPFTTGLEALLELKPTAFEYNGEGDCPEGMEAVGLIAQEAADVIPTCVRHVRGPLDGEETDLLALNTSDITWMVVNALRQIDERLRRLELDPKRRLS